jgi:hypothetical protein
MTASDNSDALQRLNAALAEDILAASDEAILAEAHQDGQDPDKIAAAARALFEKALVRTSKVRLIEAQAAVAADRRRRSLAVVPADPAAARRRLQRLLSRHPEAAHKLTLAARKGQSAELSDDEVRGWLEDLEDLGISDPDPEI